MKAWAAAILPLLLASCGSIDSIPLDVKGESALKNVEHGIRYYQPAPYLIVMELPATKPPPETGTPTTSVTAKDMAAILQGIQGTQSGDGAAQMFSDALSALAKGGSATPSGSPSSQAGQNTGAQQPQSTGPSSSSSDTSFSGTAATYVVKLVYLPDLSHPYALQMKPGLFNAVSMQPTLVDGWMFSSLNGSVDNTALPAAIASAIGGGSGGSKSSGASGSSVAAKAATAAMVTAAQKAPGSVTPTDLTTTGTLVGAGEALPVDAGTLSVLNTAQIAAYLGAMANAMGARQISQATLLSMSKPALIDLATALGAIAQQQQPQQNLLAPGIYGFDYTAKGHVFCGVSPVVLFEDDGTIIAPDRTRASDYAYCSTN